jgi:gliding motility-associated-like protein
LPPVVPTTVSVVQPTCAIPSGTITITTQSGVEYSLDGTTYQESNVFGSLASKNYTLYVRNSADATCVTTSPTQVTINAVPLQPIATTTSIVQPTCAVQSGTIVITQQTGMEYSLDNTTYQGSNTFTGLIPGSYTLYVRNSGDLTCAIVSSSVVTINSVPTSPIAPTLFSVVQPTCAIPSGTITIVTQTGVEYSLNGSTYQTSEMFSGLVPNTYILYVRNIVDHTCSVQSVSSVLVDALPPLPAVPTLVQIIQPTCLEPTGSIEITPQAGVQYSIGNGYQDSNVFENVAPGNYILSVRFTSSIACISSGTSQTINPVPPQIQFETSGDCDNKQFTLTASPLGNSYDPNTVSYLWTDKNTVSVGTNSNVLNVSEAIESSLETETFPLEYTLTITSASTGCETSEKVTVESIYCNLQKGISPGGNGLNDYFDLRLMDVKKLEIFNRYGIKVYSKSNYTDQWKGQSDNGNELPSATYYYVIEMNNGQSKTGWIYLIREK